MLKCENKYILNSYYLYLWGCQSIHLSAEKNNFEPVEILKNKIYTQNVFRSISVNLSKLIIFVNNDMQNKYLL